MLLESLSIELTERLRQASPEKQRQAAIAAGHFALTHSRLRDALFQEMLQRLQDGESFSTDAKSQIEALVTRLDNRYFDLSEAAEAKRDAGEDGDAEYTESAEWFRQARAANCLLNAMGSDPFPPSSEAIYEATFTTETPAESTRLFDIIASILSAKD